MQNQIHSSVQHMSFYTTGTSLTRLLRTFIKEGSFSKVKDILENGGMGPDTIKQFFLFKRKFKGNTSKGDLLVVSDNKQYNLSDILATAIATAISNQKNNSGYTLQSWEWRKALTENGKHSNKNLIALNSIFSFEEISDMAAVSILGRFYTIKKDKAIVKGSLDGAILRDGTLVQCGYMGHNSLFKMLYQLGLSSSDEWIHDDMAVHISSSLMNGSCVYNMKSTSYNPKEGPMPKQAEAMMYHKKNILGVYGGIKTTTTPEVVRIYTNNIENNGSKYGNLTFIKKYYPHINLPEFSKNQFQGKVCIRTSPKYSMPGLLSSKFNITPSSINEIKAEFDIAIELMGQKKGDNELYWFYQEYIPGGNGVCHYFPDKNNSDQQGRFTYAYSNGQGDIVKGIKSNTKISEEKEIELHQIAKELANDLNNPVQLEFVLSESNVLYIVQLRTLKNNPSDYGFKHQPRGKVLVTGTTFSTGLEYTPNTNDITADDILIVSEDADSSDLLGKKALIVESDMEFSHILALSKALGIPSLYNTGPVDVSQLQGKKLYFCANNIKGWVEVVDDPF